MKRMFLYLSLAAVAVVVAALLLAPTSYTLRQSVVLSASPDAVYDQLRLFNRFPQWSVWKEEDPKQKHTLAGRDGEPGARYYWEGVTTPGTGYQELLSCQPGRQVSIQCNIETPYKSQPQFDYYLQSVGDGSTRVEQVFRVNFDRPMNLIALCIGLRGKMNDINARSLHLLDRSLKADAKAHQSLKNQLVTVQ